MKQQVVPGSQVYVQPQPAKTCKDSHVHAQAKVLHACSLHQLGCPMLCTHSAGKEVCESRSDNHVGGIELTFSHAVPSASTSADTYSHGKPKDYRIKPA